MTDRTNDFLLLFNRLTEYLRALVSASLDCRFPDLVGRAAEKDATVRRDQSRLLVYGKLRNAIVHGANYPPEVIAEPTHRTLIDFRTLVEKVTSPTPVIPRFEREVRCFDPHDPLRNALAYMRTTDYSQVAIRENGRLRLLTTEGIAWWAAERGLVEPEGRRHGVIADALAFEFTGTHLLLRRDQTVDDAREAFATEIERQQPRLYALLITETGADTEEPLGIITPWDLLGPDNA